MNEIKLDSNIYLDFHVEKYPNGRLTGVVDIVLVLNNMSNFSVSEITVGKWDFCSYTSEKISFNENVKGFENIIDLNIVNKYCEDAYNVAKLFRDNYSKQSSCMNMLNKLLKDSKLVPQTILYKINSNIITIKDQEEALTDSCWSFYFANEKIPGSDIEALQAKACENPYWAYKFAYYILGADIKYCQEHACKDPKWAYVFARDIPGADIKYCQEHACRNPEWAYNFALYVTGADKEYCKQACEHTA